MLTAPCVLSVWFYGSKAAGTIAVCVLSAVITDFAASILINKQYFAADLSALCTGIMIAMMMPAGVPAYVGIVSCAFAVLVVKLPFGGGMRAPFVPAAVGMAFATVCFTDKVFAYPAGRESMVSYSMSSLLASNGSIKINATSFLDLLTGNIIGPMGTGCMIVMAGCLVFLYIRRRSSLYASVSFLITCAVAALLFPRTTGSAFASPLLELSGGSLMFAAVFLLTDYATLPKRTVNKVVYGVFCGILCMVMRHTGAYEETVCFAVILANAFSPLLEMGTDRLNIIIGSSGKSAKKEGRANE